MPRFQRLVVPGFPHHVTQRGVRRQQTFFDDNDYRAYIRLAHVLLREKSIDLLAYCLMPNHIHAVVIPRQPDSLSTFFGALHQRHAWRTNCKYDWQGHLWQQRFFSVAMDEAHTLSALRYVELNPVRAGLVSIAEDWPWSSARGNLGLAEDTLLSKQVTRELIVDWKRFLASDEDPRHLRLIRRQTGIGRPQGDDAFMDRIERASGRCVRVRRGRPNQAK